MTELQPFPSIVSALRTLLLDRFDALTDVRQTWPPDAEERVPLVRVEKIGGSRTQLNDYPLVDLELLATTKAEAESLAEDVDAFLLGYPLSVLVDGRTVVLDRVSVPRVPAGLPWEDAGASRYAATYSFSVRRR